MNRFFEFLCQTISVVLSPGIPAFEINLTPPVEQFWSDPNGIQDIALLANGRLRS